MPGIPKESLWVSGNTPFPINVAVIGALTFRTNFLNSEEAPDHFTPPPA